MVQRQTGDKVNYELPRRDEPVNQTASEEQTVNKESEFYKLFVQNFERLMFMFGVKDFTPVELRESVSFFMRSHIETAEGSCLPVIPSKEFTDYNEAKQEEVTSKKYQEFIAMAKIMNLVKELIKEVSDQDYINDFGFNAKLVGEQVWLYMMDYQGEKLREFSSLFYVGIEGAQTQS